MKRLMVGAGVLAMVAAGQAFAADMPLLKAPPMAAPVATGWTGFYVGGEFGSTSVNNNWDTTCVLHGASGTCGLSDSTSNPGMKNSSFRPGIYAGAMFQAGSNWVLGLEGDYAFYNKTASVTGIPGCSTAGCGITSGLTGDSATLQNKNDGSLRVRGGFLVTPDVLLYATGGLAWTNVSATATCTGVAGSSLCGGGLTLTDAANGNVAGYTVGGGVEWKIFNNWLLRGEYRYNHYGDDLQSHFLFSGKGGIYANTNSNASIATAGLAYMFPIPK